MRLYTDKHNTFYREITFIYMNSQSAKNISLLIEKLTLEESEAALRSLYELYFDKLVRFTYLYVQSHSSVEEIISDVFLSIWINRKELSKIQNFNAYILTITRNKAISHFRKEEKYYLVSEEYPTDLYLNTETTPEDDYISQELIQKFNKAINTLPPQCKTAFKLIREDKMKYKDAALVLNISIKTLEAHITKATKVLRKVLDDNI